MEKKVDDRRYFCGEIRNKLTGDNRVLTTQAVYPFIELPMVELEIVESMLQGYLDGRKMETPLEKHHYFNWIFNFINLLDNNENETYKVNLLITDYKGFIEVNKFLRESFDEEKL